MARCRVLVVGLGPAGAAAAMTLRRLGLEVLVGTRTPWRRHAFVETLSPAAVAELSLLGIGETDLTAIGCPSYGIEAAWGRARPHFHSHLLDPPAMRGWHVDRDGFHRLLARAIDDVGVGVLEGFRFVRAAKTAGGWTVPDGRRTHPAIDCQFIVDATGRGATVARSLGVRRQTLDRACAVYGTVGSAPADVLRVMSQRYGWWYSAPFTEDRTTAVLISDSDILRDIGALDTSGWSALATRAGIAAPPFDAVVRTCSCGTACLDRFAGRSWLAVGDAAFSIEPLDGHGIYRALCSGRLAGEAIAEAAGGNPSAVRARGAHEVSGLKHLLEQRRRQYDMETRWTREPFWSRRQTQSFGVPRLRVSTDPSRPRRI